jgi:hypothetical protein
MEKKKPRNRKRKPAPKVIIRLGKAGKIDPKLIRQAIIAVKKEKQGVAGG